MKLIIDTHALIWYVHQVNLLSQTALAAITSSQNELIISAATTWEISIKTGLGKLTLSQPYLPWIRKAHNDLSAIRLPIDEVYADMQSRLPFHHRDPFDRMLVSQALVEAIPIVSNDTQLDAYRITCIW